VKEDGKLYKIFASEVGDGGHIEPSERLCVEAYDSVVSVHCIAKLPLPTNDPLPPSD